MSARLIELVRRCTIKVLVSQLAPLPPPPLAYNKNLIFILFHWNAKLILYFAQSAWRRWRPFTHAHTRSPCVSPQSTLDYRKFIENVSTHSRYHKSRGKSVPKTLKLHSTIGKYGRIKWTNRRRTTTHISGDVKAFYRRQPSPQQQQQQMENAIKYLAERKPYFVYHFSFSNRTIILRRRNHVA